MNRTLLLVPLLAIAGCAVPSTGVTPLSDGLYKVAHHGSGAWVTTDSLKTEATKEANAYCAKTSKQARVVDVKQIPARPFGGWPESEVLFKCDAPS
jgi:hypothetical protein